MTGDSPVLDFCRSFSNRNGVDDLTARVSKDMRVLRAAYAALGSQVAKPLFSQLSSRLNEQATVNGLVGRAHGLIFPILGLQPSGDLFRRPVQNQFTRNEPLQVHMDRKKAPLGPQGRLPGFVVGFAGSIHRTATMTCNFPAHRRHRSVQKLGYLTYRRTGSDPRERCPLAQAV